MVHVRLLGELAVQAHGRRIEPPASRRAWSLLAWLALHPGEHPRSVVAAAFWPDVLDSSARASLRSAAWALRRALGPAADDALTGGRDRIGLRCETDLAQFDALVAAGDLAAAAACCGGPLLADLDEDWVFEARDAHAHRVSIVLQRLAEQAATPDQAIDYARRRLALDPLDEAAARDLMTRLAAAGDRAGALAAGERLRDRLRGQLGIAPAPQTRALMDRLRDDDGGDSDAAVAVPAVERPAGLIDRDAELGVLRAAWRRAAGGEGLVLALVGEGGIGKTRLAGELLAQAGAEGARTAACASMELGGAAPLGLWAELLRALAPVVPPVPADARWPDELASLVPSLPARLGRPASGLPAPAAPELQRARLAEATVDALEHAAADRPLALLFEDVHLADRQSLELLAYVARRLAGTRVLLVLTRRHAPAQPALDALLVAQRARDALVEIELAPLSRAATGELVRSIAQLDPDAHDQVVAAADGNPLLAVESARAAAHGLSGPPPSLRAVVRAAAGALPDDARRVAELAAVAGRELGRRELAAIAPAETVVRAMDSGLFVSADGRFGFRHALLREAVIAELPDARARELHEQLAGIVDGTAAEVARHLRLAGHDERAAERLAAAADEAVAVGAVEEAAAYLEEAIALAPGDGALRLQAAEVHAWRGRRADAEHELAEALALARDPAARARANVEAAKWYSGALCWPRRTLVHARAAVEELDTLDQPDPGLLARALAYLAWGESNAGDLDRVDALLERVAALRCTDPAVAHEVENARAFRLVRGGDLEGALQAFVAMAASADLGPDRAYTVWANAASLAGALGRHEEALAYAGRGLERVRGMPPLVADLEAIRATIFARTGRYEDAREAVAAERRAAERSGAAPLMVRAEYDEGMVCVGAGENDRAVELLYRSLEGGALVSRPAARLARAEALARLQRPDEADAELRAVALEPVGPADRPAVLVARMSHVQGLVALARGDHDLARSRLEESAAGWRRIRAAFDADEFLGNLVDLGRPTAGTVEPSAELARVEHELEELTRSTHADVR